MLLNYNFAVIVPVKRKIAQYFNFYFINMKKFLTLFLTVTVTTVTGVTISKADSINDFAYASGKITVNEETISDPETNSNIQIGDGEGNWYEDNTPYPMEEISLTPYSKGEPIEFYLRNTEVFETGDSSEPDFKMNALNITNYELASQIWIEVEQTYPATGETVRVYKGHLTNFTADNSQPINVGYSQNAPTKISVTLSNESGLTGDVGYSLEFTSID